MNLLVFQLPKPFSKKCPSRTIKRIEMKRVKRLSGVIIIGFAVGTAVDGLEIVNQIIGSSVLE
jgi:hypothetical protein